MQQPDAAGYLIHMNDGDHPGGTGSGGLIVQLKADDEGNNDRDINCAEQFRGRVVMSGF